MEEKRERLQELTELLNRARRAYEQERQYYRRGLRACISRG